MISKEMDKTIYSKIMVLKEKYGCLGIKSEFENEASDFKDLVFLRYETAKAGMKLNIKIGGVEAFTDLKMVIDLHADGVIVPMVESAFALVKSQNMIHDLFEDDSTDFDVKVNIETKTAVDHLDEILDAMDNSITGFTIGRSDLSYSYGMKGQQDSDFINQKVEEIVDKVRAKSNVEITVGGGISRKTFQNTYFKKHIIPKLTCIETRNVIFNAQSIENDEALWYALDFEKDYLNYKILKNKVFMKHDEDRFETLNSRG
jgi:4-hydroxy-2-oxoheptanedioate aldolase